MFVQLNVVTHFPENVLAVIFWTEHVSVFHISYSTSAVCDLRKDREVSDSSWTLVCMLPSHLFAPRAVWLSQPLILVLSVCLRVIPPVLRRYPSDNPSAHPHIHPTTQTSPTTHSLRGEWSLLCRCCQSVLYEGSNGDGERWEANRTSVVSIVEVEEEEDGEEEKLFGLFDPNHTPPHPEELQV